MTAYYNEFDPKMAAWMRELIRRDLITPGDVDERDIREVKPDDVKGYRQCHFFGGVGGWSRALRLAGWPDDRPVWTGSCPCQDFSLAGKRAGFAGDRDLWPVWARLIGELRPDRIFGEQVDDSPEWWDQTAADLENLDYAAGPLIIPACAVGARHIRHRLFFCADALPLQCSDVDQREASCQTPRAKARGTVLQQSRPRPDSHAPRQHGQSHDLLEEGEERRASQPDRGLLGLEIFDGWWRSDERPDGLPSLVRNADWISAILGGFGNAIVPQVAAEFIGAIMDGDAEGAIQK